MRITDLHFYRVLTVMEIKLIIYRSDYEIYSEPKKCTNLISISRYCKSYLSRPDECILNRTRHDTVSKILMKINADIRSLIGFAEKTFYRIRTLAVRNYSIR